MTFIGRKQPAAPAAPERAKPRPVAQGATEDKSRIGKLRANVRDILAELRKVTWPSREETRNLTIVVIGITAGVGLFLGGIDSILTFLYQSLTTAFGR